MILYILILFTHDYTSSLYLPWFVLNFLQLCTLNVIISMFMILYFSCIFGCFQCFAKFQLQLFFTFNQILMFSARG